MKFVLVLFGLVTMFIGTVPYLAEKELLPGFLGSIPTSGLMYQGIIIVLGLLAVLYGLRVKEKYKQIK